MRIAAASVQGAQVDIVHPSQEKDGTNDSNRVDCPGARDPLSFRSHLGSDRQWPVSEYVPLCVEHCKFKHSITAERHPPTHTIF